MDGSPYLSPPNGKVAMQISQVKPGGSVCAAKTSVADAKGADMVAVPPAQQHREGWYEVHGWKYSSLNSIYIYYIYLFR